MGESMSELIRKSEEDSLGSVNEMEKVKQEWKKRDGRVEDIKRLKGCEEKIWIHRDSDINEEKEKILRCEQQNKEYRIGIDFFS